MEQVAVMQRNAGMERFGVHLRDGKRALGKVSAMHIGLRTGERNGRANTAAAAAKIECTGRSFALQSGDGAFAQELRFRTGDQHAIIYMEGVAHKFLRTEHVLQRNALQPFPAERVKGGQRIFRQCSIHIKAERQRGNAGQMTEQQAGVNFRVGDAGGAEFGRCLSDDLTRRHASPPKS